MRLYLMWTLPSLGARTAISVKAVPTVFEAGATGSRSLSKISRPAKILRRCSGSARPEYRELPDVGEAIIGNDPDGNILSGILRQRGSAGKGGGGPRQANEHPGTWGCQDDLSGILKRVHLGEPIRRHEMKMMRKGGAVLDALITISPILGNTGRLPRPYRSQGILQERRWNSTSGSMKTSTRNLVEDLNVGIYRHRPTPAGSSAGEIPPFSTFWDIPPFRTCRTSRLSMCSRIPQHVLNFWMNCGTSSFVQFRHLSQEAKLPR